MFQLPTNSKVPQENYTVFFTYPESPWSGFHIDFAGPMVEQIYFVLVAAYNKLSGIFQMA